MHSTSFRVLHHYGPLCWAGTYWTENEAQMDAFRRTFQQHFFEHFNIDKHI